MSIITNDKKIVKVIQNRADIKKIYKGSVLLWESIKYYDGIPCYIDNKNITNSAYLPLLSVLSSNDNFFVAICDIGAPVPRRITFGYGGMADNNVGTVMKVHSDAEYMANSIDYWSILTNDRRLQMNGRYLAFAVYKGFAKYFRVFDDDGNYYLRGNEVEI